MSLSPFPIDPHLTAISIAYRNQNYIADMVAPRVRVGKQEFKYLSFAVEEYFSIPDTLVGRRGRVNEVEMDGQEITASTTDYGLETGVPQNDINNADARYNPVDKKSELLTELIDLDREKRVADLVFGQASYHPDLTNALAGSSQFSDPASDPIGVINAALDAPLMRPNQIVFGNASWSAYRAHPKVVKAVQGNDGDSGLATREQVARLFEVDEVLVGQGRANSAKPGQAAALYRLWGKHIALLYRAPVPDSDVPTFCATFQWGEKMAGQWEDKNIGLRGGTRVRVGESVKEAVVANQAGYLIRNAVA